MGEWKEYKVADLLRKDHLLIGDGYRAKNSELSSSGIPFARAGNINGGFRFSSADFFPIDDLAKVGDKISQAGDIVFTSKGTVGRFAIVDQKTPRFVYSPQLCYWRSRNQDVISSQFLYYWMHGKEFLYQVDALKGQTDMADYVSLSDQRQMVITLPEIYEQRAIASILSSLDDKIDLLQRQNQTLEALAETLFRQWFVEEADEEWEMGRLGDVFDIGIGRTPPRKEQHWFSTNPNDIKWVSIKDMGTSGVYVDTTAEYLTQDAVEKFGVPIIPENTVLLSFKMTIGRLAISTEPMLSNEAIAHFKQKEDSFLFPEFVYLYLKSYQWEQLGSTSSIVESINSQMIKDMELVFPDEKWLKDFKKLIKPYFEKIRTNQSQIRMLTQLRDTLLPKLMSGEVRVRS